MIPAAVYAAPGAGAQAELLAREMGVDLVQIERHVFPDGESRIRAAPSAQTAYIYAPLDRPNTKLIEMLFAVSALRDQGAARLVLVAPYLCYMRQDKAFREGEAVSQRVIGALIDDLFDCVVTIDPHLHRIASLADIFPSCETRSLSAAPLLSSLLEQDPIASNALIVGPDAESRPWAEAVARPLGLDVVCAEKTRRGDRAVQIDFDEPEKIMGRSAVLVDDVISSGETLKVCARLLKKFGAVDVQILVSHALAAESDVQGLIASGVTQLRSTDSVPHSSNAVSVSGLLATALASDK